MTDREKFVLLQFFQFLIVCALALVYAVTHPYEYRIVWTVPLMTSILSIMVRIILQEYVFELRDERGRPTSSWNKWLWETGTKYKYYKVRDFPSWFMPLHIAGFMFLSAFYCLAIPTIITGKFIFLEPEYAHLSIPIVIYYHFVTDFEGWKRLLKDYKTFYCHIAYTTAGAVFWYLLMAIGVFPKPFDLMQQY
ncbi:hypothetical protein Ferp_0636 [Ferroglobus placidus DSM 10642]|uniref:Uncharacterized protein n=1 Tax=Ferroglobus placidus (strain DSM 10642 / AEDII12DO) TaxID=589924 RepID=D3S3H4_FERPA|nr:hypothetical protein [Ferroglobus placidus]ADC64807.1 hypothetical protein Ferp_0636 [Ferroglobus placidus DSM 10642]